MRLFDASRFTALLLLAVCLLAAPALAQGTDGLPQLIDSEGNPVENAGPGTSGTLGERNPPGTETVSVQAQNDGASPESAVIGAQGAGDGAVSRQITVRIASGATTGVANIGQLSGRLLHVRLRIPDITGATVTPSIRDEFNSTVVAWAAQNENANYFLETTDATNVDANEVLVTSAIHGRGSWDIQLVSASAEGAARDVIVILSIEQ